MLESESGDRRTEEANAEKGTVVSISCPLLLEVALTRVVIFCSTVALATVAEVSIERIAKLKGNNCFT